VPVRADADATRRSANSAGATDLAREARIFTRYLVARDCPPPCADRFARGTVALHSGLARDDELAVTRFAVAHPWTLPLLDAGAAITGRGRLLRARLQLMAAVLETTPEFADDFLPRASSRARVLATLAWSGLSTALMAVVGAPLLYLVRRRIA